VRRFTLILLVIAALAAVFVRVRYGGGEPYVDLSTEPLIDASQLRREISYPEPVGNIAISSDGRLFFTVHPESRPQGNKLLEWKDGAAVPFPDGASQQTLFGSILGLTTDRQGRLWTIDHGRQGFGDARLFAFDIDSRELLLDRRIADTIAPAGSFLQEIRVTGDGRTAFISDGSIIGHRPALIVYDIATGQSRRLLESHASVSAGNYVIRTAGRDLSYLGGLFVLKGGINGLAISIDDEWLYFAAISHGSLFRVPVKRLRDIALPAAELELAIERYSDKPLSDGLLVDRDGNVYVTDVEHNAVMIVGPDRKPRTLVRSEALRWASSIAMGPDDALYVADSAFQELVLRTRDHIHSVGPFSIFRIQAARGEPPH